MRILAVCFAHDVIPVGASVVVELHEPTMQMRVRLARPGDIAAWFPTPGSGQLNTAPAPNPPLGDDAASRGGGGTPPARSAAKPTAHTLKGGR